MASESVNWLLLLYEYIIKEMKIKKVVDLDFVVIDFAFLVISFGRYAKCFTRESSVLEWFQHHA